MDTNNESTYFVSVKKKLKKNSRLFSNREKIFYLINKNKGYLTTKEISQNKIARDYLRWLVDYGEIKNVERGIYIGRKTQEDIYYTYALRFPKIIYSHLTSLYLQGFISKEPELIQMTCINNVYADGFSKFDMFYIKKEWYEIGLKEIEDNMGYTVKVYDIERSIIDIIRSYKRFDIKYVKRIVNKYLNSENKNIDLLLTYAEQMNIYDEIVKFMNLK